MHRGDLSAAWHKAHNPRGSVVERDGQNLPPDNFQKLQPPRVGRVVPSRSSLSRNAFVFEKLPLQALLNAVRVNAKLYHMQMDWQDDKMLYTFLSYLKIKPHIQYFCGDAVLWAPWTAASLRRAWKSLPRFWRRAKARRITIAFIA